MQTRIGKYLLRKKLGTGASGTVYLAVDEFTGREVALKCYEAGVANVSRFVRAQFLTEASLAGRLWHPHIARIVDACADDAMSYIVTEFVPGGSLAPFTQPRGLLPVSEVVEIAFKCSGALDYAFRTMLCTLIPSLLPVCGPIFPAPWEKSFCARCGKPPASAMRTGPNSRSTSPRRGRLSVYDKSVADSEKFTVLKSRPMLAELDDAEIWEFARAGTWSRVPSRAALVREGETGDSLFLLASGEAKVTLQGRLLNVLAAGEWFGEQPFIHGQPMQRQATVETATDAVLVEFRRQALEGLGDRCQKRFARALLRTLADRLALSNVRISRMG